MHTVTCVLLPVFVAESIDRTLVGLVELFG